MRYQEYRKLEHEFNMLVLDFWMKHSDLDTKWMLKLLTEEAAKYTEEFDERYEELEREDKICEEEET